MFRPKIALFALLLPLGACGGSDRTDAVSNAVTPGNQAAARPEQVTRPATKPSAAATLAALTRRSCAEEIGKAAAAQRVNLCIKLSPATHPPCNAANSCAMIEDEIARSCALLDGDGAPVQGCTVDSRSSQAAADVVRRYYAAIDARDFATAWTQWGDDGRPGQTFAAFEKGFAHTRATKVKTGTLGPSEGAAGSIYQTVPVTVEATLDDGSAQRFAGSYVVRRINNVDGASPSQLRWHLASATLRPAPVK